MARVEMYTTGTCPFCVRAKRLLEERGIPFDEINVGDDDELRADLILRTGRRTVPQIFIDGKSIGGYEELHALDVSAGLSVMLKGDGA
jgi:glutaredoxin 3